MLICAMYPSLPIIHVYILQSLAAACITVFRSVSGKLHPLPSAPHLLFTLHDLTRLYQGLLLISPHSGGEEDPPFSLSQRRRGLRERALGPSTTKRPRATAKTRLGRGGQKSGLNYRRGSVPVNLHSGLFEAGRTQLRGLRRRTITSPALHSIGTDEKETNMMKGLLRSIVRLWCHESTRVFADRLSDSKDRIWFVKLLDVCLKYCFCGLNFHVMAGGVAATGTARIGDRPSVATTATTGRRARPGRQRTGATQASGGGGGGEAFVADLVSSGIRVDSLQKLLPAEHQEKLLDYEQVTVRGEDLSGLLFAQLPAAQEEAKGEDSMQKGGEEGKGVKKIAQRLVIL